MTDDHLLHVAVTPSGVGAGFTTRQGGESVAPYTGWNLGMSTGDAPAAVGANRRRLADAIGIPVSGIVMSNQVHGTVVRRVDGPDDPRRFADARDGWPDGDGLVTQIPGVALLVLGADCLPVLLWRNDGSAVAAVHAGWRGLIDGVIAEGVRALGGGEISAAIGPGAGPCCYQVDDALRGRFRARYGASTVVGDRVDLPAAARVALIEAGVGEDAITGVGRCTVCEPTAFFSHRRDGARSGRQAGVIWRTAE